MSEELQIRIKKLEKQKEIRERKEKKNNIVIKKWEIPKRDLLEVAVQKMLQRELHAKVKVNEAFWTRRGTNIITAKLKDEVQRKNRKDSS